MELYRWEEEKKNLFNLFQLKTDKILILFHNLFSFFFFWKNLHSYLLPSFLPWIYTHLNVHKSLHNVSTTIISSLPFWSPCGHRRETWAYVSPSNWKGDAVLSHLDLFMQCSLVHRHLHLFDCLPNSDHRFKIEPFSKHTPLSSIIHLCLSSDFHSRWPCSGRH